MWRYLFFPVISQEIVRSQKTEVNPRISDVGFTITLSFYFCDKQQQQRQKTPQWHRQILTTEAPSSELLHQISLTLFFVFSRERTCSWWLSGG